MSGSDETLRTAAAALLAARFVAVCSHVDPDGDAVGSTLAAMHALDAVGVRCVPLCAQDSQVPTTYAFLPGSERYASVESLTDTPDTILALDSPHPSRLGAAEPLLGSASSVIVMDHHPDNTRYGTLNIVDETAPSTASVLLELLAHLKVSLDPVIAACAYTALMTDTGRFSYSNATPAAFRTAARLIDAGADPAALYRAVYEHRSLASLELQARVMSRLTLANAGVVAYSWIADDDFAETGALPEETENLIDEIRTLAGVEVVALLKVHDGYVKGSLRAKEDADVGTVARSLGGGGHRAAAGFTAEGDLGHVLSRLLPLLPAGEPGDDR
ncbi:MAG: DHHA1 domain-containing protein [Actinomycetia bacterium]|nr:DHHA1 domain-containing protein [Actinomycetes bacterium]